MPATYSAATVKRSQTIIQRAAAAELARRKAAKATTVKTDWKIMPASAKQIQRIQRKERTLGLPITPSHGAGFTGQEAREWNATLNVKLAATR
jgi:hypothetical protein